jgi:hypothetical protein
MIFEHPAAPSYGSRYPLYATLEAAFTEMAHTCGAEIRVQGADPEAGSIPDAGWIKVLDTATLVQKALCSLEQRDCLLPVGWVCFETEAGSVTIGSTGENVTMNESWAYSIIEH